MRSQSTESAIIFLSWRYKLQVPAYCAIRSTQPPTLSGKRVIAHVERLSSSSELSRRLWRAFDDRRPVLASCHAHTQSTHTCIKIMEERLLISSGRDSRFISVITRLHCVTNADRLTVLQLCNSFLSLQYRMTSYSLAPQQLVLANSQKSLRALCIRL